MSTSHVEDDMEAVLPGLGLSGAASTAAAPATESQFGLMRRCQEGDVAAFEELVRSIHPRVYAIIRGILRRSNDVDDIAQQVFAKVYFSLKSFNFRSAVGTWIYKIAVNECYDHLRKQKVRKAVILADLSEEECTRIENLDIQGEAGDPSELRRLEVRDLAAKLLDRLSPEDRILLVLKEIEGYSVAEVAEVLNLNENTVKVRLFRARQTLLAAMKRKRWA